MAKENRGDTQTTECKNRSGSRFRSRRALLHVSPAVYIFEHVTAITVLADMPGVKAQYLEMDLRENVLTLTGRVSQPAPEGRR
jgi:HSP20 family molecular chaperone IbpA